MLPQSNLHPPFNLTRASHVVLSARDLGASREFYTEIVGLVVTDEDRDTLYFRAYGEHSHHSLVLKRASGERRCERVGLRVFSEEDLDIAKHYFEKMGLPAAWVEVPEQGRTLHASDIGGTPLEICASMPTRPRLYMTWEKFKGGSPRQLDHVQVHLPDVPGITAFYADLGFRVSEYGERDDKLTASFMFRKGDAYDLVFITGKGPSLHHFAYAVPEVRDVIRACDLAGNMGMGECVERGPSRHVGPGGAFYAYFRDPDGHRIELFNHHYQTIDIEVPAIRWSPQDIRRAAPWGLPGQRSWFDETTPFTGVARAEPANEIPAPTLEAYLAQKKPEKLSV